MSSFNVNAGWVHRLWNGSYHFYTNSDYEAQVLAAGGGWVIEALNYTYMFDQDDGSMVDLMRCYSTTQGMNIFTFNRAYGTQICALYGMQNLGSIGKMRVRNWEDYPIAGRGQPIYFMYRVIGRAPDGSNISDTLITTNAYEASLACGRGWMPVVGASYRTCLAGYVVF
jgi:hypothetical protein